MNEELRDRNGKLIGKIKDDYAGKSEIRNRNGKLEGTYDSVANTTRDRNGRLIGKGNQLTTLLKNE